MSIRVLDGFDVLITGGRVVDGTGNPWYRADVGVRGDRIAAVGKLDGAAAKRTLDAAGKVVAPGFIDTHVHGDLALLMDPLHEPAVRQGVTTYLVGQDGVAMAPASPATFEYMCRYTAGFSGGAEWLARPASSRPTWNTIAEYLACLDRHCAVNVATLIPNGNVRMEVLGLETRPPTADELSAMVRLVREGMEQGAVGLSSGMDYIPSLYAQEDELTELCRAVAPTTASTSRTCAATTRWAFATPWPRCSASVGKRACRSTSPTSTAGPTSSCPSSTRDGVPDWKRPTTCIATWPAAASWPW